MILTMKSKEKLRVDVVEIDAASARVRNAETKQLQVIRFDEVETVERSEFDGWRTALLVGGLVLVTVWAISEAVKNIAFFPPTQP